MNLMKFPGRQAPLTNTHDIELETTLQQLPLDLGGDAVETDMAVGENGGLLSRSSRSSGGHYVKRVEEW